jgi:hypothetical protein
MNVSVTSPRKRQIARGALDLLTGLPLIATARSTGTGTCDGEPPMKRCARRWQAIESSPKHHSLRPGPSRSKRAVRPGLATALRRFPMRQLP